MAKTRLKKSKWTLSFDSRLKSFLLKEARRKGVYPTHLLEELVRDRFNPYGHTDVRDASRYVHAMRKRSDAQSDEAFLAELRAWQKSRSS
jgi:hypothetical protein